MKYSLNNKKTHMDERTFSITMDIINDLIPFLSGRPYRVLKTTKQKFYNNYLTECQKKGIKGYGYNYIWYKLLKKERIHLKKDEILCSICLLLEQEESSLTEPQLRKRRKNLDHKLILTEQYKYYKRIKNNLSRS